MRSDGRPRAHVNRIADQDQRDVGLDGEPSQDFDIVPSTLAVHGFQSLSREAEFIAESQADAFLPQVESQNPARFFCGLGHDSIVMNGREANRTGGKDRRRYRIRQRLEVASPSCCIIYISRHA